MSALGEITETIISQDPDGDPEPEFGYYRDGIPRTRDLNIKITSFGVGARTWRPERIWAVNTLLYLRKRYPDPNWKIEPDAGGYLITAEFEPNWEPEDVGCKT